MAQPKLPVQALVHAFHCRDANCVERFGNALNPKSCVETQAVLRRMKAHVDSCHIRQQQGQADVSACKVCKLWDALRRTTPQEKLRELVDAAWHGRVADVTRLLSPFTCTVREHVNATAPPHDGRRLTALAAASSRGHADVVTLLLATDADVNWARAYDGATPLIFACVHGHTDVVTLLLAANADVNTGINTGSTPMSVACKFGHLEIVQLLSSYGARRAWQNVAPNTAEGVATHCGHHEIAAWLAGSRHWSTALHHLEIITSKRAFELLRAAADVKAAAVPGGSTPFALAQVALVEGKAKADSAAFLVLAAAKPWSRQTHKLFPAPARARAVELMLVGELLSREERFAAYGPQAVVDAWMTFVVPGAVGRSRVQIVGLKGRPELNGQQGACGELVEAKGRYPVRLESGEAVLIKMMNLMTIGA